MNLYITTIFAKSPKDGKLKEYGGPCVPGITKKDAQNYCENNGLGYCKVEGLLVAEIPCIEGTLKPDWSRMVDYEKQRFN